MFHSCEWLFHFLSALRCQCPQVSITEKHFCLLLSFPDVGISVWGESGNAVFLYRFSPRSPEWRVTWASCRWQRCLWPTCRSSLPQRNTRCPTTPHLSTKDLITKKLTRIQRNRQSCRAWSMNDAALTGRPMTGSYFHSTRDDWKTPHLDWHRPGWWRPGDLQRHRQVWVRGADRVLLVGSNIILSCHHSLLLPRCFSSSSSYSSLLSRGGSPPISRLTCTTGFLFSTT